MALIVGGDCNSRILNPDDIKTYPLFGDGAGAVLLTRGRPDQGLLSFSLGSDGGGGDLLSRPACGSRLPPTPELIDQGHALHAHGRPGRLPLGRRHPLRHHSGRAARPRNLRPQRRRSVHSRIKPTSASSTPPSTCCTSRAARSTTISIATATPRPVRCRWPWTRRSPKADASRATCDAERLRRRPGVGHGGVRSR